MKKRLALALVAFLIGAFASAQGRTAQLTIICNVPGAQVFVSGRSVGVASPELNVAVAPGNYVVRITRPGYQDFETRVSVGSRGFTLRVALVPAAQGTPQPMGEGGQRNVPTDGGEVQTPGRDVPTFNRSEPVPIPVSPRMGKSDLIIACNIDDADVYINNILAGKTPFRAQVLPGTYSVRVVAEGYADYEQGVIVGNGPLRIYASLQGSVSSWFFRSPGSRSVQLWIDGVPQALADGQASGQILPGRHSLRIASGDLVAETPVDILPGRAYSFEPFLGISVK
jgi:PEGA domain.